MTPPPAVPNPFVWKYGDADVVGTWHKGIILILIKLINIIGTHFCILHEHSVGSLMNSILLC